MPLRHNQDIRTSQQDVATYPDNPIYKAHPIAQYTLQAHVDTALLFSQPEGNHSSDKQQIFSSLSSVVVPPSTNRKKAQASSRPGRPSNAFMLFRSDFVREHKHIGRRQQELSVMAACAWRALGADGQTGWYEKAALVKEKSDIKIVEPKVTRQRPTYRSRCNPRDVVHTETIRPIRETYATLSPAFSVRPRTRKSEDMLFSSTPAVQDSTVQASTLMSSSALAHALYPPSFLGHPPHSSPTMANISPVPTIQSDTSYESSNVHLWSSSQEMGNLNYDSTPVSTAASTAPSSPYHSFSSQGFSSPIQYPSPVTPSAWTNRFVGPHYDLPNVLSPAPADYRSVGFYDENSSRHDQFRRHTNFF